MAETYFEVIPGVVISAVTLCAALIACNVRVSKDAVSLWTDEERADAYRWAVLTLLHPMPEFLECYRGMSQLQLVRQNTPVLHDEIRIVEIEPIVEKVCGPLPVGGPDAA